MKTIKLIDDIIRDSVETHVSMCMNRKNEGFRVLEVEVPLQYASQVFTRLNDELSHGKRLYGWQFGVFSKGEFEGKMAQVFKRDDIDYKRYFLKYTL